MNTKCGCPYCKGENPTSRMDWKKRKNKHDRGYGMHVKNQKHPRARK